MSLVFANPLMLFGLVAGMIPILIHRLTHQKTVKKPFSAVRLLVRSKRWWPAPSASSTFSCSRSG
jgi:hypothetical protein